MPDDIHQAAALMAAFTERTAPDGAARRYLWTDAFAVCNFLGLARATGDSRYRQQALELIERVHHTLGRHRPDDRRRGWISGLPQQEARDHPTRGGLRIGKELPERAADEPLDDHLEWERDGQYFHYLTRWMHALDQAARATGQPHFNRWARELADTAYQAFTYRPFGTAGPPRMYWKMSIDLSRPLVSSMGQHDPLDGYITTLQLRATASLLPDAEAGPRLAEATSGFRAMLGHGEWASADPLGIGGLLVDAWRLAQIEQQASATAEALLERLLGAALTGLQHYARSGELQRPAYARLAFRELGLAIGLHAAERLHRARVHGGTTRAALQALVLYLPLRGEILSFWREPAGQRNPTWSEHRDINEVMLATALAPGGYLDLLPVE